MSEGYTESIQKALDIALFNFCGVNSIAVQVENGKMRLGNVEVAKSTSTPYLAGYFIPAPNEDADLYFTDKRSGIYQIDINYASHFGTSDTNQMEDKLNAYFAPGNSLTRGDVCVQITNFSATRVTVENGWAIKPVTITWQTHTERL
jgi:hypothetical protein